MVYTWDAIGFACVVTVETCCAGYESTLFSRDPKWDNAMEFKIKSGMTEHKLRMVPARRMSYPSPMLSHCPAVVCGGQAPKKLFTDLHW